MRRSPAIRSGRYLLAIWLEGRRLRFYTHGATSSGNSREISPFSPISTIARTMKSELPALLVGLDSLMGAASNHMIRTGALSRTKAAKLPTRRSREYPYISDLYLTTAHLELLSLIMRTKLKPRTKNGAIPPDSRNRANYAMAPGRNLR